RCLIFRVEPLAPGAENLRPSLLPPPDGAQPRRLLGASSLAGELLPHNRVPLAREKGHDHKKGRRIHQTTNEGFVPRFILRAPLRASAGAIWRAVSTDGGMPECDHRGQS